MTAGMARFEPYGVPRPRSEYTPPEQLPTRSSEILGYVSQCECCGQRAITVKAYGRDWVCPRCAEVAEPSPYTAGGDDDGPELRKVRG